MRFSLVIDCDNDAFGPSESRPTVPSWAMRNEVKRLLDVVRTKVHKGATDGVIMDANGNKVGSFEYGPGD